MGDFSLLLSRFLFRSFNGFVTSVFKYYLSITGKTQCRLMFLLRLKGCCKQEGLRSFMFKNKEEKDWE